MKLLCRLGFHDHAGYRADPGYVDFGPGPFIITGPCKKCGHATEEEENG